MPAVAVSWPRLSEPYPPGAMVPQLPFIHFPEAAPVNGMADSDHLRMYVCSHSLRWSHGAVKGRFGSDLLSRLCEAPIEQTLERFAVMGYQGIHIDRRGYADHGQAIEARLSALLGVRPVVSAEGRDVFFDARPYSERLKVRYTDAQWTRLRECSLSPVRLRWGSGFQGEGVDGKTHWRQASAAQAEATVINPLNEARPVTLHFRAQDYAAAPARLTLSGPLVEDTLRIDPTGTEFSRTFMAPPGENAIHFVCDAAPLAAPEHAVVFALIGYDLVNETPPDLPTDQQSASVSVPPP